MSIYGRLWFPHALYADLPENAVPWESFHCKQRGVYNANSSNVSPDNMLRCTGRDGSVSCEIFIQISRGGVVLIVDQVQVSSAAEPSVRYRVNDDYNLPYTTFSLR